jgi:hypothetical protein
MDNMRALQPPFADAKMRQRMLTHVEALPEFGTLAQTPWYSDKQYAGVVGKAQSAVRARGG